MKKCYRKALSACYVLLFVVVFNYPASLLAEQTNSKLDQFLDGLETFSAAFEQTLFDERGDELEKSLGVFYMRNPGMFHWAYWEPYTQTIISDGVNLWIYDEDLEQVIIKDVSASLEDSPAAILGGEINIDEHYLVIDMGKLQGTDWLELTPRDINSQYDSIRMGFVDGQLDKILLFNNLGQKHLISFLDKKRNTPLDLKLFTFTVPEGIDVIDSRE